jgi:hypothetical protein
VLEYLSRYTHSVAISDQRQVEFDERGETFRSKDYRKKGPTRYRARETACPRHAIFPAPSGPCER